MKKQKVGQFVCAATNIQAQNDFQCFQAEYTPSIIIKKNDNQQQSNYNLQNKSNSIPNSKLMESAIKIDLSVIYENSSEFGKCSSTKKSISKGQNIQILDGSLTSPNKISRKSSKPIETIQSQVHFQDENGSMDQIKLIKKRGSKASQSIHKIEQMQNQGDHQYQQIQSKIFVNLSNPQSLIIQKNSQSKISNKNYSTKGSQKQTFQQCLNIDQISSQLLQSKRKDRYVNHKSEPHSLNSERGSKNNSKIQASFGVSSYKSNESRPRNLLYF